MSICPVCGNNDERFFSKKGEKYIAENVLASMGDKQIKYQ